MPLQVSVSNTEFSSQDVSVFPESIVSLFQKLTVLRSSLQTASLHLQTKLDKGKAIAVSNFPPENFVLQFNACFQFGGK